MRDHIGARPWLLPHLLAVVAVVGLAGSLLSITADQQPAQPLAPKPGALRARGDGVIVDWSDAPAAEAEARHALGQSEQWVVEIEQILFEDRPAASRPIEVRFNGDARIGDPPRYRVPHVDARGVVQLYRYGPSHVAALPHELVHAVLRRQGVPYPGFDEEGLANWVAHRLRPSFPGFPAYDHPLELIVGHWHEVGARIPLATLRERQRELNLKCSFQAYPLRASFFLYLGDRFGDDPMRAFARSMGQVDVYQRLFGASLEELEQRWLDVVLADYERLEGREALRQSYLRQPAISSAYVCTPGVDF
jgi:hypothetical protein